MSLGIDDFGHAELVPGLVGSVLKEALGWEAGNGDVFAHFVGEVVGMSGGFDAFDIDLGKLLDVLHDICELLAETGDFFVAQIDARKVCDIADIDGGICHARRMYRRDAGWK